MFRKKVTWIVLAVLAVAGAFGLWAFQPWRLFTSSTIDEALPDAVVTSAAPTTLPTNSNPANNNPTANNPATTKPAPQPPAAAPRQLAAGAFMSQEHETSGQAAVLELADGSRVLRLTGLSSSDGPDLHVWLTDASAGGEWGKYDDGRQVKLGKLKATHGNQNYVIPAGTSLAGLRSVVIWCDRFNVAFGSAPLAL